MRALNLSKHQIGEHTGHITGCISAYGKWPAALSDLQFKFSTLLKIVTRKTLDLIVMVSYVFVY